MFNFIINIFIVTYSLVLGGVLGYVYLTTFSKDNEDRIVRFICGALFWGFVIIVCKALV